MGKMTERGLAVCLVLDEELSDSTYLDFFGKHSRFATATEIFSILNIQNIASLLMPMSKVPR